jgi:hypothetical protein
VDQQQQQQQQQHPLAAEQPMQQHNAHGNASMLRQPQLPASLPPKQAWQQQQQLQPASCMTAVMGAAWDLQAGAQQQKAGELTSGLSHLSQQQHDQVHQHQSSGSPAAPPTATWSPADGSFEVGDVAAVYIADADTGPAVGAASTQGIMLTAQTMAKAKIIAAVGEGVHHAASSACAVVASAAGGASATGGPAASSAHHTGTRRPLLCDAQDAAPGGAPPTSGRLNQLLQALGVGWPLLQQWVQVDLAAMKRHLMHGDGGVAAHQGCSLEQVRRKRRWHGMVLARHDWHLNLNLTCRLWLKHTDACQQPQAGPANIVIMTVVAQMAIFGTYNR